MPPRGTRTWERILFKAWSLAAASSGAPPGCGDEMKSQVLEPSRATQTPPFGHILTAMQIERLVVDSSPHPFPI